MLSCSALTSLSLLPLKVLAIVAFPLEVGRNLSRIPELVVGKHFMPELVFTKARFGGALALLRAPGCGDSARLAASPIRKSDDIA